jgi:hypothetical protein
MNKTKGKEDVTLYLPCLLLFIVEIIFYGDEKDRKAHRRISIAATLNYAPLN